MHHDEIGVELPHLIVAVPARSSGFLLPNDRQIRQDVTDHVGIRAAGPDRFLVVDAVGVR